MFEFRAVVKGAFLKLLLKIQCFIFALTNGKYPKSLFLKRVSHSKIKTDVKILKATEESTFIYKENPRGEIEKSDFKILIFTDLHIGDNPKLRDKTFDMVFKNIERTSPDLILFTGDIILSKFQQLDSLQFSEFMEEIGIYWAVIFGNHEGREEKEFHKYFMLKNMMKSPHCLTKIGDEGLFGFGNFFINIMDSENKLKMALALFDSGRDVTEKYKKEYNLPKEIDGYDFIKENQIVFYEENIKSLQEKYGKVNSMIFTHIPIPEYKEIFTLNGNGKIPVGVPTGKGQVISGTIHENVSCPKFNSGFFIRAKKMGVTAFFAGHDHFNDFWAKYEDVNLIYNEMSGYEEYHLGESFNLPESEWNQGATLVTLGDNGKFNIERYLNSDFLKDKTN